ncbi:MAG: hypothetical protein OEU32_04155 [Acidimicrobiia bacterium]|nr:hypothetical protein [Acidimicrobiia bacterium]
MLLWFGGMSFVIVVLVFDSPGLDYRLVALGSIVPGVELLFGGPWVMHTLLFPVALMAIVMGLTRHRRLARRRWLGFPIGAFLYLVLEGAWRRTELFWWPAFGLTVPEDARPELKSLAVIVLLEVCGLVAIVWAVRRFRLDEPQRRSLLIHDGRLSRDLMYGSEPSC